jgi:hypothetical protein
LLLVSACAGTIAEQKPRAWFVASDDCPACEPLPEGFPRQPRPLLVAVGSVVEIGASWSAVCRYRGDDDISGRRGRWERTECDEVPHDAELVCDNPACRVSSEPRQFAATLTAPGRYPMRVRFTARDGKRAEVALPTVEAVEPDEVVVACGFVGEPRTSHVKVSLLRGGTLVPGAPSVEFTTLDEYSACREHGNVDNAALFECPAMDRIAGEVRNGSIVKSFDVVCR